MRAANVRGKWRATQSSYRGCSACVSKRSPTTHIAKGNANDQDHDAPLAACRVRLRDCSSRAEGPRPVDGWDGPMAAVGPEPAAYRLSQRSRAELEPEPGEHRPPPPASARDGRHRSRPT